MVLIPLSEEAATSEKAIVPARKKHRGLIIAIVIAVAVAVAATFLLLGRFSLFDEVSAAQVEQDISQDPTIMAGFASNDYVDASAYRVGDVQIADHTSDHQARTEDLTCTATLTNDFFRTQMTIRMHYYRDENGDWAYEIVGNTTQTTALRGISHDSAHDLTGATLAFDAAAQICSEAVPFEQSEWYKTTSGSYDYDYAFDGTAWRYVDESERISTTYQLDGEYRPVKATAGTELTLTIGTVDSGNGTFTISWNRSSALTGPTSALAKDDSSMGSVQAVISANASDSSDYAAGDGLSYSFAANGTDAAGGGTAFVAGEFLPTDDGTEVIKITVLNVTYTDSAGVMATFTFSGDVEKTR